MEWWTMLEQLIIWMGNVGAGIFSGFITAVLIMFPYYWMSDTMYKGSEPSDWLFGAWLVTALTVGVVVGKAVYRAYRKGMIRAQAQIMVNRARVKANKKMARKYANYIHDRR